MPEGDVVFRTARRLQQALAGRPLTRVELRWGDLDGAPLLGRQTLEVVPRGKHLLHRVAGGWTLHTHLRMEGSWRVVRAAELGARELANPGLRVLVASPDWACLGLRLGMVDLLRTDREADLVGHLGPDILGPDWDADRAVTNLLAAPARAVGEALLDQRALAGIGTMFAAESLFLEGVHPWAPVGSLGPDAVRRVVARARRLMRANLGDAIQSTTGSRRRGEETWVHARSGRECRRCGGPVRVAAIGAAPTERVMFYCPSCQGGPAAHDDGAPQAPLGSGSGRGRGYRR